MGLFDSAEETALMVSRTDADSLLSSFSGPSFVLDEKEWPTVEHYFQAKKFTAEETQEKIRLAATPKIARKMGRSRFRRIRKDWSKVRRIVMTRALYTKFKTHKLSATQLLDTKATNIIENNNYDYYWGCGRDRRGDNTYGKVLMDVRTKLVDESSA